MYPEFETIEEIGIDSEIVDTQVKVLLRRQLNHKPTRFSYGPYWLDLYVGSVHISHYGVDEHFAREAAVRFLLKHANGIAPKLH